MPNAVPTRAEVADFTRRAMALEEELLALYAPFNNDFRNFVDHERNRYPEYVSKRARCLNLVAYRQSGLGDNALDPLLQDGDGRLHRGRLRRLWLRGLRLQGPRAGPYGRWGRVHNLDFLNNPLPFEDNSVDVILSIDSLEHWYRGVRELMAEIRRVTRIGAKMMIVVPNAAHLKHRVRAISGRTWARFEEW